MFGTFSLFKNRDRDIQEPRATDETFRYCPKCKSEYRAEFTTCGVCDVSLVKELSKFDRQTSGSKVAKPIIPIKEGEELAVVKTGGLVELKSIQRLLEKGSIASKIAGDDPNCSTGRCGSSAFELLVRPSDLEDTFAILKAEFEQSTALAEHDFNGPVEAVFDERLEQVSCPACGSRFMPDDSSCPECGLCF